MEPPKAAKGLSSHQRSLCEPYRETIAAAVDRGVCAKRQGEARQGSASLGQHLVPETLPWPTADRVSSAHRPAPSGFWRAQGRPSCRCVESSRHKEPHVVRHLDPVAEPHPPDDAGAREGAALYRGDRAPIDKGEVSDPVGTLRSRGFRVHV